MNIYRKIIRIWLAIASFIGFIAGWVFLSHTVETKTVTYVGNAAVNNVQTFTVNRQSQSLFSPFMRTGGS